MGKRKISRRLRKLETKEAKEKAKVKSYKKKPKKGKPGKRKIGKKKPIWERVTKYFKNVWLELKKVSWPSRSSLISYTLTTLTTILIFVLFIGICDFLFTQLIIFLQKIKP